MELRDEDTQSTHLKQNALPPGFWRLILIAVVIGNLSMMLLFRLGVADWLAVSAPILSVGIAGVIIEYRKRTTRSDRD